MMTLVDKGILSGAENRPPMLEKDIPKKYSELSATEAIQADCDVKATNIILQGLPPEIQDYALWDVIENGDSWVSVPQTTQENGTSVTKMSILVTAEEKTNKKNDVKARGLLLMALPNEYKLTFSQYPDAKSMFTAIEIRFRVVWMNKPEVETMSINDLYNNFKNLAFMTAPRTSSTNDANIVILQVSAASPNPSYVLRV
ncbi:hypothetical protein Tco_0869024 [Tanacetum coccineum]